MKFNSPEIIYLQKDLADKYKVETNEEHFKLVESAIAKPPELPTLRKSDFLFFILLFFLLYFIILFFYYSNFIFYLFFIFCRIQCTSSEKNTKNEQGKSNT